MKKLWVQALIKFLLGAALIGLLIFGTAGSFSYWQGWLFMGLLFLPMGTMGIFLLMKNPELLEKRLRAKEEAKEQQLVVKLSGLMFIIAFALAGLGVRFGWPMLPGWLSGAAGLIFLLSYGTYFEVLRENTFLSRTIEVQENQQVVDTGLYGVVRHPMYSVTLLLFLSMPLVLGSPFAFLILLAYPLLIVRRIQNEEKLLEKELPGYKEYEQKVKYRLLPFLY